MREQVHMKKKSIGITTVIIIMASLLAGCGEHAEENRAEEVKESETETGQTDEWTETEAETGEELQVNCDDTEEMILLARVIYNNPDGRSTVECEYEYDSLGNRTKELIYDSDGNIREWREWEYDAFGSLVKEKEYTPFSSVVDLPEEYWQEREYDSSGNLIRETWYDFDGGIDEWREYEYDESGNPTKMLYYDSDRNVEYQEEWKYDEFGNQIMKSHSTLDGTNWIEWEYDLPENPTHGTETHYDWDGKVYAEYERTYAATGSLSRKVFYHYNEDGFIWWEEKCEYDSFGNKIMEITYEEYGRFNSRYEWEYDSFGNKITEIGYEENGSISNWCEWEYDSPENPTKETATYYNTDGSIIGRNEREYDAFGNRTREISYDADGKVKGSGWMEWERDEWGNCTKEIWYYPDGRIGYWRELEYITLDVVSEEDSADLQPFIEESSYKGSEQLPEEITKQIAIYVSEREAWLPEFWQFMPRYYYTWNDLNLDGSLELICSYYEGTGWYSHSYVYAINSDGEVECVADIGGESAPDLLWGLKLYADVSKEGQALEHFYILTQDVIHDERYLDRIDTVITFTVELTEWQRERFRSCLEEYRDVTHSELVEATYWGSGWETISKEEWEQLEKEFLENKELITADFVWGRLWTYTYEELIESALSDKELGEALEALYISWQELEP